MSTLSTSATSFAANQTKASWWHRARTSNLSVACLVALVLFTQVLLNSLDMLVYGAVIPCLPALVLDKFHGTPKDIGFLFGCFAFGYLVATPLFGILSDKYQNRRYGLMLGTSCIISSTLLFAWSSSYTVLAIARVCQGASAGASWTIGLGMLADAFPVERLGRAMGTVILSHTVGFLLGPVLGGFLYDYGGTLAPFYFCSVFGLLTLVGTVCIAEPIKVSDQPMNSAKQPVPETATAVDESAPLLQLFSLISNPRITACLLCCFVTSAALAGIEPALPIHLESKYHVSTSTIGVIFIALVVPSFLGPVTGYLSDKFGRPLFISIGMVIMSIASILVGLPVSSYKYMLPSLCLFGMSNPLIHTPLMPEMGAAVTDMGSNAFAQVYALYNMAYSLGIFVGPLLAGVIMSCESIEMNRRFQILMLIFSGVIILSSPVIMMNQRKRTCYKNK
ncbi:major facilitator superfamily domain-containing protein [Mucor lusitanicus]|uniref:Major facilitator superfamily domain-containing protein n=1 Tax=Mucor circinelloides f. lusitanicus TaxID=29924 RepID=A0A8H4EWT7_MUCCL|nr:major facilitator superfamily domain-containing protein [Mucor lusitanicus]